MTGIYCIALSVLLARKHRQKGGWGKPLWISEHSGPRWFLGVAVCSDHQAPFLTPRLYVFGLMSSPNVVNHWKGKLFYHTSYTSRVLTTHRTSSITFSSIWNLLCFCKMVQGVYKTGKVYRKGSYCYVINSVFIYKQKHWGFRDSNCHWDSRCQHDGAGWRAVWILQVNTPGFLIQSLPRETHIAHFFHLGEAKKICLRTAQAEHLLKMKYHLF